MAIYRNQAGQKIAVFAYTPADGQPTTGDAASITAYLSKDWGAAAALADTNPTELDATNMPGWYVFDLAQAETDAEVLIVAPQSATTGVVLDQVQVFTLDATISSRAPAATALANTIWTDAKADYLDAAITSRLATAGYTAPDNAGISSLLDRLTALRAGYLDKLDITGTLAHSDAADTYKADVSSLATQAAIDALGLLIGAIKAKTDLLPADPAGVSNIPDISALALEATAQTIAGYLDTEIAAILAAVDTEVAAIKAKTDQMVFTVANKVDATAEATVDEAAIADAVIAGMGDLVADVWNHTPRTLTSPATGADDSTTATAITRRRGDDWSIAISSLSLAGYTEVWFTIKRGYEALDIAAMLQVTQTGGLERINGAAPAAGDVAKAALVVNGTNDTATITVNAEITAQLATGTFMYDLQWKNASGDIHTVSLGTFTITSDVTRATS